VELLDDVDGWLDIFRDKARSDNAPSSVRRALSLLDLSILALCRESSNDQVQAWRVQDVLIALGRCERTIVLSSKRAKEAFVKPVTPLSKDWLVMAMTDHRNSSWPPAWPPSMATIKTGRTENS